MQVGTVRSEQVMKILEITDTLGLHRENVTIPLTTHGAGEITVSDDGKIIILCPDGESFEEFLLKVRSELQALSKQ